MIEHREIKPPVIVSGWRNYDKVLDELIASTPPGTDLSANKYFYSLSASHQVGAVTVLRTGRALVRTIPRGVDLKEARRWSTVTTFHVGGLRKRQVLTDVVPGRPDQLAITHVFIHKPGYSPGSTKPKRKPRWIPPA